MLVFYWIYFWYFTLVHASYYHHVNCKMSELERRVLKKKILWCFELTYTFIKLYWNVYIDVQEFLFIFELLIVITMIMCHFCLLHKTLTQHNICSVCNYANLCIWSIGDGLTLLNITSNKSAQIFLIVLSTGEKFGALLYCVSSRASYNRDSGVKLVSTKSVHSAVTLLSHLAHLSDSLLQLHYKAF